MKPGGLYQIFFVDFHLIFEIFIRYVYLLLSSVVIRTVINILSITIISYENCLKLAISISKEKVQKI